MVARLSKFHGILAGWFFEFYGFKRTLITDSYSSWNMICRIFYHQYIPHRYSDPMRLNIIESWTIRARSDPKVVV